MPAPIAPALRQTIALGVLGVRRSPSAPVIPVAAGPVPLCLRLVGSVVLVSLTLAPLPSSTPLTLTSRLPAVALPGNLRTRSKCPPAARALPTLHGSRLRAQSTREAWAAPSADNKPRNAHHTMQGGYSVSGSIPLSNPGSIRVSAEERGRKADVATNSRQWKIIIPVPFASGHKPRCGGGVTFGDPAPKGEARPRNAAERAPRA